MSEILLPYKRDSIWHNCDLGMLAIGLSYWGVPSVLRVVKCEHVSFVRANLAIWDYGFSLQQAIGIKRKLYDERFICKDWKRVVSLVVDQTGIPFLKGLHEKDLVNSFEQALDNLLL